MGFSSQGYWSGLPFPPPGNLPDMGVEPVSPVLAGRLLTTSTTWEVSNTSKPAPSLMIQIDQVLGASHLAGQGTGDVRSSPLPAIFLSPTLYPSHQAPSSWHRKESLTLCTATHCSLDTWAEQIRTRVPVTLPEEAHCCRMLHLPITSNLPAAKGLSWSGRRQKLPPPSSLLVPM